MEEKCYLELLFKSGGQLKLLKILFLAMLATNSYIDVSLYVSLYSLTYLVKEWRCCRRKLIIALNSLFHNVEKWSNKVAIMFIRVAAEVFWAIFRAGKFLGDKCL